MRATLEERFWSKVNKTETCWIWNGAKDSHGYGSFGVDRKMKIAHRLAVSLSGLELAPQLDHICHNRACVNPAHLRPVTHKQNQEHKSGVQSNNLSGYRGVSYRKRDGKWRALVMHNWKPIHLGYFDTPEEANEVVVAKRNELFTHNDADRSAA